MKGGLINFKDLFWSIKREPFTEDLDFDKAAEYALEFIKSVNIPSTLMQVNETLPVEEYTASLPKNIMNLKGVRYKECENDSTGIALTSSAQLFEDTDCNRDLVYTLKGCNLVLPFREGFIDVSYNVLPLDEDGYPLIPEFGSFPKAIIHEITYMNAKYLFYLGKIPQKVFNHISQERSWYVAQALEQMQTPTYDEANTIANSMNRILVDRNLFEKSFKGMGRKEHLRRGM